MAQIWLQRKRVSPHAKKCKWTIDPTIASQFTVALVMAMTANNDR